MFFIVYGTDAVINVPKGYLIATAAITLSIIVAFYFLRSIGVYKLAKGSGVKNAYLSFIPLVWIYPACKAIGDSSGFFGKSYKSVALILCLLYTAFSLISFANTVLSYYPLASYLLQTGDSARVYYTGGAYEVSGISAYPFNQSFYVEGFVNGYPQGVLTFMSILRIFNMIGGLVTIVIEVSLYFSLFRKFWPEHYLLASLLSIFLPLFPVFVFAVRNRKGINYAEYIRERYERYYAERRGFTQNNGDGGKSEPFTDFKERDFHEGGDPFEEFSDDKKDDKKDDE